MTDNELHACFHLAAASPQELDLSDALQGAPTALAVAPSLTLAAVGDDEGFVTLVDAGDEPTLKASGQPLGKEGIARLAFVRASQGAGANVSWHKVWLDLLVTQVLLRHELLFKVVLLFIIAGDKSGQLLLLVVGFESSCCALSPGALGGGATNAVKPKNASMAVDVVGGCR